MFQAWFASRTLNSVIRTRSLSLCCLTLLAHLLGSCLCRLSFHGIPWSLYLLVQAKEKREHFLLIILAKLLGWALCVSHALPWTSYHNHGNLLLWLAGLWHVCHKVRGRVISAWNTEAESLECKLHESRYFVHFGYFCILSSENYICCMVVNRKKKKVYKVSVEEGRFYNKNCGAFTRKGRHTCQAGVDVSPSCIMKGNDGSSHTRSCHTLHSELIPSSRIGIGPLELMFALHR